MSTIERGVDKPTLNGNWSRVAKLFLILMRLIPRASMRVNISYAAFVG